MCAHPADITAARPAPASREAGAIPAGSVLVIEDNDAIGGLLRCIFVRRGRTVHRAANGRDALRLFALHADTIAFVVLDCRLPDMHGPELGRQLRARVPELPIVYTSGRDCPALTPTLGREAATAFLPKPFFPADVERAVERLAAAIA